MDGSCPWCGEESGIRPERAACDKTLMARVDQFDHWLEAHIPECPPYLAEQGINDAAIYCLVHEDCDGFHNPSLNTN